MYFPVAKCSGAKLPDPRCSGLKEAVAAATMERMAGRTERVAAAQEKAKTRAAEEAELEAEVSAQRRSVSAAAVALPDAASVVGAAPTSYGSTIKTMQAAVASMKQHLSSSGQTPRYHTQVPGCLPSHNNKTT